MAMTMRQSILSSSTKLIGLRHVSSENVAVVDLEHDLKLHWSFAFFATNDMHIFVTPVFSFGG